MQEGLEAHARDLEKKLAARERELSEVLERQTATSEVLRVISTSPTDVQPVFEMIVRNAVSLCGSLFANVFRFDGELLHFVTSHNVGPSYVELLRVKYPMRPNSSQVSGRVLLTKSVVRLEDVLTDPDYDQRFPQTMGWRRMLGVPMLRYGNPLGVIVVGWGEAGPVSKAQEELLKTFADQAVIAIENVRLLDELRQRTDDLRTAHDRVLAQAADLATWNRTLEKRVAEQVAEIERVGRLKSFLPPQIAQLVISAGHENVLESHRRDVTVVFCDLRGFTAFSELAEPEEVMLVLREYYTKLGVLINKFEGTVERFSGDGLLVVFNDPLPCADPSIRAVQMALEMRDEVAKLSVKWSHSGHDIGFGVGITHGYATLGSIGYEGRFQYSVTGKVANLASRLCDQAKNGQILVDINVFSAIKTLANAAFAGELVLRGFSRPVKAFNVCSWRSPQS